MKLIKVGDNMAYFRCINNKDYLEILKGTNNPSNNDGVNGQVYLKYADYSNFDDGSLLSFDDDLTDEYGNIWKTGGSPVISANQSKFGGKSLYLDGDSYIRTYGNTALNTKNFDFGSNDFTISAWIYPTKASRQCLFILSGDGLALDFSSPYSRMWFSSTSSWDIASGDNASGIGNISINANEWTHIAYVRKNNNLTMYVNGQISKIITMASGTSVRPLGNDYIIIGKWDDLSAYGFEGYIDDFVVLNGIAFWKDAFTPPTEALSSLILKKSITDSYAKVNNTWQNLIGTDVRKIMSGQKEPKLYTNGIYYPNSQQITDVSNFTKLYDTTNTVNYGTLGTRVENALALTDETTITSYMNGGWDDSHSCFYDNEYKIGAYGGYNFGSAKVINSAKFWLGRFSAQNDKLTVTIEVLDSNGNWNEITDLDITTDLAYPVNISEVLINQEIYGIRWIHKKSPYKTTGNNVCFFGMTLYEGIGDSIGVYIPNRTGYIEVPAGYDGIGALVLQ